MKGAALLVGSTLLLDRPALQTSRKPISTLPGSQSVELAFPLPARPHMYNNAPGTVPENDMPLPANRERVYARTRQLALNAGRYPHQISKADYDRAMREVTGETDRQCQHAILDAAERERLSRVERCEFLTADDRQPAPPRQESRDRNAR